MIYSSVVFIFFVAFSLCLFLFTPKRFRSVVLLLLSILWYSTWSPLWSIIYFAITIVNYGLVSLFQRAERRLRSQLYSLLIIINIVLFIGIKLLPHTFADWQSPLGLSFYFLSLLAILIDQRRASTNTALMGPVEFSLSPLFFPALVGGPIVRGQKNFSHLKNDDSFGITSVIDGILIFSLGFIKRFFLFNAVDYFVTLCFSAATPGSVLAGCFLSTLQAYIEFSSYCDMGRGAARCFGVNLNINFKPFYYAKNPSDLWSRWNISLGEWMRDYVSFPLMLRFGRKMSPSVLVFISFLLIGLWHGLTANWLFFGLFNGFLISLYHQLQIRVFSKKPDLLKVCGLLLSWILFAGNGFFQNENFLQLLQFNQMAPSLSAATAPPILVTYGVVGMFLLLGLEFFQEKLNNADFYLALPLRIKAAVALCFAICFLWSMHEKFFVEIVQLPPLYFRF